MKSRFKLFPIIILAVSILLGILAHTIRHYYIIEDQFINLIIASLPSFAAALGLSMIPIIAKSKKTISSIMGIATGLLIYEAEQLFTSRAFDINDITAIILGILIGYIIVKKNINTNERAPNN